MTTLVRERLPVGYGRVVRRRSSARLSALRTAAAPPRKGGKGRKSADKYVAAGAPVGVGGVGRNAGGSEEPHSDTPQLWNFDGTEVDMNATYTPGKQLWYIQDRAKDKIKAGLPIAGLPMNDAARKSGIAYKQD